MPWLSGEKDDLLTCGSDSKLKQRHHPNKMKSPMETKEASRRLPADESFYEALNIKKFPT